jgi:putative spermidine/putrescine transport system permease protein
VREQGVVLEDHPDITPVGWDAAHLGAFLTSWDEVVTAIFLTTTRFRTLPVVMWEQVREVVDPSVAAVATVVLAVTTTILLLRLSRTPGPEAHPFRPALEWREW